MILKELFQTISDINLEVEDLLSLMEEVNLKMNVDGELILGQMLMVELSNLRQAYGIALKQGVIFHKKYSNLILERD